MEDEDSDSDSENEVKMVFNESRITTRCPVTQKLMDNPKNVYVNKLCGHHYSKVGIMKIVDWNLDEYEGENAPRRSSRIKEKKAKTYFDCPVSGCEKPVNRENLVQDIEEGKRILEQIKKEEEEKEKNVVFFDDDDDDSMTDDDNEEAIKFIRKETPKPVRSIPDSLPNLPVFPSRHPVNVPQQQVIEISDDDEEMEELSIVMPKKKKKKVKTEKKKEKIIHHEVIEISDSEEEEEESLLEMTIVDQDKQSSVSVVIENGENKLSQITKTWTLKNSGLVDWKNVHCKFQNIKNSKPGSSPLRSFPVSNCRTGETVKISIDFFITAKDLIENSKFISKWKLHDENNLPFGETVECNLDVDIMEIESNH